MLAVMLSLVTCGLIVALCRRDVSQLVLKPHGALEKRLYGVFLGLLLVSVLFFTLLKIFPTLGMLGVIVPAFLLSGTQGLSLLKVVLCEMARVLVSTLDDIIGNLALEECLQKSIKSPLLFLWRNKPAVTIGRHQNPWKECNLQVMDSEGVTLARRQSGGGAVFQDMGCTTYSFLTPISSNFRQESVIAQNFDLMSRALKKVGADAVRSGRNDMVVGDKKVSGNAFKTSDNCFIHHGTLLVDTDFSALSRYLTPDKRKLQAKGVTSVRSRVMNINELGRVTHADMCGSISQAFREANRDASIEADELVDFSVANSTPGFTEIYSRTKNWEWRFGTTPQFSHYISDRIEGVGQFDIHYDVNGGRIVGIKIFTDCLAPETVDVVSTALIGRMYSLDSIHDAIGINAALRSRPDSHDKLVRMTIGSLFDKALAD